ncbi:MAG: hypothetical protein AAGK78_00055 [Planctomycetota bacterium]
MEDFSRGLWPAEASTVEQIHRAAARRRALLRAANATLSQTLGNRQHVDSLELPLGSFGLEVDANRDRTANLQDFLILRGNFNTTLATAARRLVWWRR